MRILEWIFHFGKTEIPSQSVAAKLWLRSLCYRHKRMGHFSIVPTSNLWRCGKGNACKEREKEFHFYGL